MEEEQYVANIVEFTGGIGITVNEDGIKPEKKTRKSIERFGYILGTTIGNGAYSKVKLCYSKKNNKNVAVKIIPKKTLPEDYINKFLPREIALLQKLEHSGLVHLFEVFETMHSMYLVMEYMPRGDLREYINKTGGLHEADARRLFKQLTDVVSYLHKHKVYHRDIKLDNILIDAEYNIKLTDFGFARYNPRNEKLQTFCGSYAYAPPEILDGENYDGAKADVWSMGVCLFGILNGKLPFKDTDDDVLRESMKEHFKFYKRVSRDGRNLVRAILEHNFKRRYSLKDIIHSNWMCRPIKTNDGFSMSSLAIAAVSSEPPKVPINPNAEHGYACAQYSKEPHNTLVTDLLRSVAVNHASGLSSIDLKEVPIPEQEAKQPAILTGVTGPLGRKLSSDIISVTDIPKVPGKDGHSLEPSDTGTKPKRAEMGTGNLKGSSLKAASPTPVKDQLASVGTTNVKIGTGNSKDSSKEDTLSKLTEKIAKGFGQAGTEKHHWNKFRLAARMICANYRFKHSPLNTILTISQEQAMKQMIELRQSDQKYDLKHLRYAQSAKVAALNASEFKAEQTVKKNPQNTKVTKKVRKEDVEDVENAIKLMAPNE